MSTKPPPVSSSATEIATWIRTESSLQSVSATVQNGAVIELKAANLGEATPRRPSRTAPRLTHPQKRSGDRLETVSWEAAIREIGDTMKSIRAQGSETAFLAGARMGTDSLGSLRAMATQFVLGPASLHSHLADHGAPWIRAAELVIGHPVALQADVSRAHYAVLLGSNQPTQGWGPLQASPGMDRELAQARKVKSNKLIAVDARKTPMAEGADLHMAIRPGTELYFLLGMTRHILDNNWRDVQYTNDWTVGLAELGEALAPWTLERCADACGVAAGDLGGIALKFSRAAMAVCHLTPQAMRGPNATLTAWASLVLHAVTANLLRPGGLYENKGIGPAQTLLTELLTDKGPTVAGLPMLLAQASAHLLPERILTPGHQQVRGLLCLTADPATELCGPRVEAALRALELLVAVETTPTATSRLAHFVLPTLEPFEREDINLLDTVVRARRGVAYTPALVPAPAEARSTDQILHDLQRTQRPALKSPFGPYSRVRAGIVARGSMLQWADKALADTPAGSLDAVRAQAWDGGDVDRATWRLSFEDNHLRLLPASIATALGGLTEPRLAPGQSHWLLTSAARDGLLSAVDREGVDPGVTLHPDAGFAEGDRIVVRTATGSVSATVHLDATLRADTVDLPAGYAVPVGNLIPDDVLDAFTGTPIWDGLGCSLTRA